MSFDLDAKLMQFGTGDSLSKDWCIKHSILGVQCFGSNGSGKSSSMRTLALKYLKAGYGFLVLSAKSERETWLEYCELAGRTDDLVIIGPNDLHRFDFMKYLSENNSGGGLTANLLDILKSVIQAGDDGASGKSEDAFWEKSLNLLLYNTLSLCQLAYGQVNVQTMYDIIQSAPSGYDDETGQNRESVDAHSAFNRAFDSIRSQLLDAYQSWQAGWSDIEKQQFEDRELLEAAILRQFPKARPFKFVEQFFYETFKTLSQKTKSIILLSVSSFLFSLLQEPIYSLFCSGETTVTPEDSLGGKVILLDLPTKHYQSAGRSAQLLFKYIWQLQMEKRDVRANSRPVCLWSDESQEFLMEYDSRFQATARSSRISVVYITQNIHQYYAAMGGAKSVDRVKSFLGTLNTKLFFGNSDVSTNQYASELFGDGLIYDPSHTVTIAEKFSQSEAVSLKIERLVRPEQFVGLRSGGRPDFQVEAYIHVQGDKLFNGQNFKKVRFNQNYR